MIEYWIDKNGLEEAASDYYEGPRDAVFNQLLAQYKAAQFALKAYMIQNEPDVKEQ
jgi:hypothetical protein